MVRVMERIRALVLGVRMKKNKGHLSSEMAVGKATTTTTQN